MSDSKLENVLIIDDNSDYRKLIKTFLNKLLPGVETMEYDPVFEGVPDDSFDWSGIDVLLLDYHLSIVGTTGLDILHRYHKKASFPATIMLTGAGTEEIAIKALNLGIHEYQPKQSLTKDKLKQSIIHAWEEKKSARIKKQEVTQHNRSFSKEVFYENLEQNGAERVLVIIRPDDINVLEEEIGIIGRDNLVNHIAKNSFEVFKLGTCNPNITRISDTEIGIQIDNPINIETLEFNMQGLSKHLAKCTFKFSEEKYKFSVSIGVLKLGLFNVPAERLIYIASAACELASKTEGNSYYNWKESDVVPEYSKTDNISNEKPDDNETVLKTIKEKEVLKTELKAAVEAKEKAEAVLKKAREIEAAAKAKAEEEAMLKAEQGAKAKVEEEAKAKAKAKAEEEKEKLEAELKAFAEAKVKAEAEMEVAKKEKEKLEAELKTFAEAKAKAEAEMETVKKEKETTSSKTEIKSNVAKKHFTDTKDDNKNVEAEIKTPDEKKKSEADIKSETEVKIRKLMNEKRITQTYQPITAMFDDNNETKEIYKTGLQAISENEELNKYLSDTSVFSISLQQTINEWILRQVFLRITESSTTKYQYLFLLTVTESWFSDIILFQWLQKILSQTKKYNPGKSIILDVPIDLFNKHQKRAEALINILRKSHQFTIALSNVHTVDNIVEYCLSTSATLLIMNIEQLKKLTETLTPNDLKAEHKKEDGEEVEKQNMLQYLKSKKIRIITFGIEDSTLLTDAITAGTDYTFGDFVGEIQNNLVESSSVESFELT